uniref:Kelch domain containing 7A n=1 Tax=Podarcis muralis TaxID=64176 RepID=A0A670IX81_PODMU
MSHLGSGLPPDRKFSVAEEEKGGETSGAVLSNGNSAAVTETATESRLPSLGLLSPEGGFCSLNGSHKDVSSAENGLCLAAQEKGSGHAALHPADENGSTLGGGRSDLSGEEERQHLAPTKRNSLHQIIDNPELQVPMEGFGCLASGLSGLDTPPLSPLRSSSVSSLVGSMQSLQSDTSEEPTVELVAGAKFFHIPLSSESSIDIHLDLGNCYEVLSAYKVMSDNYLQVLRTHAIYSPEDARGRKYVAVADVSSQGESQHASRLCYYDDQKDTWHLLTHVPLEVVSKGCAMCSMFNYLFVAAGCEGRGRRQKPSNRVFCYNPLTNIWREICPLNQARPALQAGCLGRLPVPCDGEIYVTGGTLRYMLLRYVGQTDTWKFSLTGGNKDRTTEMVTVNGFIYRFDLNRSMGISVYRCGARAKLWYECATHLMPFPASFQCVKGSFILSHMGKHFQPGRWTSALPLLGQGFQQKTIVSGATDTSPLVQ